MWLHRYAKLVAASTLVLIVAGGMVTSTGSGLAVPDWPNSYGYFMFTFPLSYMVGGIFYEHGHRLIASSVGLMTIGLAVWLWRGDPRPWVKRLGFISLGAVILQGILGGVTVLWFLPTPVSVAHAGLAEIFFCLTVSLALFTSPSWLRGYGTRPEALPGVDDPLLRRLVLGTTAIIFAQILVGATMRHSGAGLAIPDFPLVFGGLLPPTWSPGIAIHFAHRVGAGVATLAIFATAAHVWYHHRGRGELGGPALLLAVLVLVQVALGGLTIWTRRDPFINTAHVATGAVILATSVVLALRAHRRSFAPVRSLAGMPAGRLAPASAARSAVGVRA